MKTTQFNVLIIDDHPLIIDAFKNGLQCVSAKRKHLKFNIDEATNCDDAFSLIKPRSRARAKKYDIIFLDIKLPPSSDGKILSGEDLGEKIRTYIPKSKIVVVTTYNNNYRLNNILKSIDPEAFMVKNDITPEDLINAIEVLLDEPPYYSRTILKLIRKQISSDLVLDMYDRQILHQLSMGIKTKDLSTIIPLSKPGIERRKRRLKKIFDADTHDDSDLIKAARKKGFI